MFDISIPIIEKSVSLNTNVRNTKFVKKKKLFQIRFENQFPLKLKANWLQLNRK